MKKILLLVFVSTLLIFAGSKGILTKSINGFVMKPTTPFTPKICENIPIEQTTNGFLFTGVIKWGVDAKMGEPYAEGLVFISEGKTRAWEYVGKTNSDGNFSIHIEPYTQFKLYAWDGTNKFVATYDGHFYYNSDLHNLYMTPTGGDPEIAPKGDVIVIEVK